MGKLIQPVKKKKPDCFLMTYRIRQFNFLDAAGKQIAEVAPGIFFGGVFWKYKWGS